MIFCPRIFKHLYLLSVAAIICIAGVSVVQADSNLQYLPITKQAKDLLSKYKCKYIFKIKTSPPTLKKGAFSGIAVKNLPAPISLKISFKALKEAYYSNIDIDRAKLLKQDSSEKLTPVEFWFKRSTQYSGILKWNSMTKDNATYLFCVPAKDPQEVAKYKLDIPLFMDGGVLRKTGRHIIGGVFYLNYFDVNNDGKKDIVTGAFHDYIRVFENIAESPDDIPLVSENHTYNLADKDDLPLAHDYFNHGWQKTAPVFYDFNNDGKDDILMGGSHTMNKVRYWENIGTKTVPVYGKRKKLNLLCKDAYKSGGLYPVPCDFNGDGKLDLIAGCMVPGSGDKRYIYFFEGLSEQADDFKFKPGVRLKDKNGVIKVPGYSSCTVEVFDWNNDGLLDLFAASTTNLFYWENKGSRTKAVLVKTAFPKISTRGRTSIKVIPGKNGHDIISGSNLIYHRNNNNKSFTSINIKSITPAPFSFGGHSTLKIIDWNGDGKNDIITSDDWGRFYCAINDGGKWAKRIRLKSNGKAITSFGCVDPGENNKGYARMAMADLNGDGYLDLLVNHERSWRFGYLAFYKNLGNGEFAAETRLDVPRVGHLLYKQGVKGKAAVFDKNTTLDYFSYPADKIFDPAGGEISFHISLPKNSPWTQPVCLLHNQFFKLKGNRVKYGDEFKISIEKNGSVSWQAGQSKLQSPPLKWQGNKWYKLTFKWGKQGMTAMLDDKKIASSPDNNFQKIAGPRLYVGSPQCVSFIQQAREYKKRLRLHKREYSTFYPMRGMIDELKIKDPSGNDIFYLPLDGGPDGFAPKSKRKIQGGTLNIAYRAAPALADLNGDGLPDLILPLCPNPNKRDGSPATLYWFPNKGSKTQARFLPGRSLNINAEVRSATRFVDFDNDGDLDLLIIKFRAKLEYYINTGTPQNPCFKYKGIIANNAWVHEAGVDVVDWNNDGQLDIVITNGDNGNILIYDKQFLDKLTPQCKVQEIITPNKIIRKIPGSKNIQAKVKKVYSNKKNDYKARNVCNGIHEGGSTIGWWGARFPVQLFFEFAKKEKISQVDCYWGHPTHALNNPAGARGPKSFLFEYWNGSSWKPLFPKVKASARKNTLGLGKTVSFAFPAKETKKIRLSVYSSYDNGKRMSSFRITPEKNRTYFIREINFYGSK